MKRAVKAQQDAQKQIDTFRADTTKQIESSVGTFLSSLRIATASDVDKLNRKLNSLTRKLRDLEKAAAPKRTTKAAKASE